MPGQKRKETEQTATRADDDAPELLLIVVEPPAAGGHGETRLDPRRRFPAGRDRRKKHGEQQR